jgi:hypothetical protein
VYHIAVSHLFGTPADAHFSTANRADADAEEDGFW